MQSTLHVRPMGVGELGLAAYQIYIRNLPVLLGLGLIMAGPPVLFIWLGVLIFNDQVAAAVLLLSVGGLGIFIAFWYLYAAAILVVSYHLQGLRVSFLQILRMLRGAIALELIGTGVLQSLIWMLGLVLLIVPGVLLFVRFALASHVVVLEHRTYWSAIRRSRDLVKGYWWRTFGALLLATLFPYVGALFMATALGIPIMIIAAAIPKTLPVATILIAFISYGLLPVGFVYSVLLYYDLVIRKEPGESLSEP